MGKRENEDNKRSKKHRRHHKGEKHHQRHNTVPTSSKATPSRSKQKPEEPAEPEPAEEVLEEVLEGFEHEEEVMCDGEVELPAEEDSEMIDVEEKQAATPIPYATVSPSTTSSQTTSPKAGTSKATQAPGKVSVAPAAAIGTNANSTAPTATNSSKRSRKRRDSDGTSSGEERWLSAIESGKLEDVDDELKKIKDPKLMTARQRAMYERQLDKEPASPSTVGGGELLMSLPTGYREKEKPVTAEDIQKAALKSQKRKQQADEKREKDKKKTMERLLKKQESNKQRTAGRSKLSKATQPMISYRNTLEGAYIQLPPEHEFPLRAQTAREPPAVQLCGIAGCGQRKVYNCSKTNLPLCSYACYRKHVQAVREIMC